MEYCALILAAGNSIRFNDKENKVFYKYNNKSILELSMKNFIYDNECKKIILVYNDKYKNKYIDLVKQLNCKKIFLIKGGKYRHDSFVKGIKFGLNFEYVMIHDAARPFLSLDLINRIKKEFSNNKFIDLVVPVLNINDSVLEVNDDGNINYLNRNNIKIVQTPQTFKIKTIVKYVNLNNYEYNDEFSWILSLKKLNFKLIDGDSKNVKITFKNIFN